MWVNLSNVSGPIIIIIIIIIITIITIITIIIINNKNTFSIKNTGWWKP